VYDLRMRTLLATLMLAATGCAPANYYYNFDVTDPGATNLTRPGERDVLEDADVRVEVLVDPTSFQSILLIITNRTPEPLTVNWHLITIIGPDRVARQLRPDEGLGRIDPYTKARARLIPFELPDVGGAASAFDNQTFELVVPMVARGKTRDLRLHLLAHAVKL
jgi:hypothetical protein